MTNKSLSVSVPNSRYVLPYCHIVIAAYITGVTSDCILSILIHTKLVQVTVLTVKIMFLSVSEIYNWILTLIQATKK